MQSFLVVSIVAILSTTFSHYVTGIPLANFYPFGSTNGDTALPPNDDGSSAPITLSMPFTFFDETRAMVFVNNNGVISFQRAVSLFTPDSFPLPDDLELIAPYWADVDTRGTGTVWYRETNDIVLRARAADDVRAAFISQSTFFPMQLFIATWERVGYFNQNTDLLNTFQCVMATDGINSFVIFLYADGEIQWTTGDASDGTGGLGGTQAQVGFNAGDGIRFASVPGSQTAEIINIDTTSNIGIPGVWIFSSFLTSVTETTLGDDPHFSIVLPESNKILCYTVQGEHGFAFNLISNKKLHMNAKFVADSKRSEVTWIGSLGIVVKNAHYLGSNVTKLRFDAKSKEIYIENKVILNAKKVDGLTLCNGKLTINEAPPNKKTETCSVRVVFTDIGLNFTINFVKEHLDMFWHSVGGQDKDSHGLIGQFFRKNVEIDEARKILILHNKEPVPVMRRPVWSFMEREKHDDRFCWAAMNEGYQGKGLIDGNYLDYLVDDVLSSDFGYKH